VVELSVSVSVAAALPVFNVAVAEVFEVTVGVPRLALVPPLTENSGLVVSELHSVLVPVNVIVGVVPADPDTGEIDSVGVATVMVPLVVPSEIVSAPVPPPGVTTSVPTVAEVTACETFATPVTPETVNVVVPLTHEVPLPVSASAILPLCSEGIVDGDAANDTAELTAMLRACVAMAAALSVTFAVKLHVPTVVGVPVIAPAELSDSPAQAPPAAARVPPPLMLQVYGVVPLAAASV